MRHQKKNKKFGRKIGPRKALLRSLAESLVIHGAIETTETKAKELRTFIEPLVTTARKGTLADRRTLIDNLYTDKAVKKLFDDIAPKYKERTGGYTKISRVGQRKNDAAMMVRIEFV